MILVYSGERVKVDPWSANTRDPLLESAVIGDLQEIFNLSGQMSWDPAVLPLFKEWYMADCPPRPDHPKLDHYIPRRHIHLMKLCQIMSASRSNDMIIMIEDYQAALEALLEAEAVMPDVFKAMRYNSDSNVIDETHAHVWALFARTHQPVYEHQVMHFMSQRMPGHNVGNVLKLMVDSGILEVASLDNRGRATYRPAPKAAH